MPVYSLKMYYGQSDEKKRPTSTEVTGGRTKDKGQRT